MQLTNTLMNSIFPKLYIFITPMIITVAFYQTKIVKLNSLLDCIFFYGLGVLIFYFFSVFKKKQQH